MIQAAACLDRGQVLVVEEPHGYQLVAIARSSSAIKRIRSILGQPHQPAMLLVATPDAADTFCDMHPQERAWMQAPDAPLIRMRRREGGSVFRENFLHRALFLMWVYLRVG